MKIFYKGIERGEIKETGEVIFHEKVMQELQKDMFFTLRQEELDDGGVALVEGELSYDLKVARLKEFGFELKK